VLGFANSGTHIAQMRLCFAQLRLERRSGDLQRVYLGSQPFDGFLQSLLVLDMRANLRLLCVESGLLRRKTHSDLVGIT
jgi:hypothetical protein